MIFPFLNIELGYETAIATPTAPYLPVLQDRVYAECARLHPEIVLNSGVNSFPRSEESWQESWKYLFGISGSTGFLDSFCRLWKVARDKEWLSTRGFLPQGQGPHVFWTGECGRKIGWRDKVSKKIQKQLLDHVWPILYYSLWVAKTL